MCQPAPLARCSNHAQKAIMKLENDYDSLHRKMSDLSQQIVTKKRAAIEDGVHSEEVMNRESTDPQVDEINKARRAYEQAERDKGIIIRDIREEELHVDATPKGLKALRENDDVYHRNLRIENAVAIRDWRKELKNKNDSNGNPILSKEADPKERRTFLIQQFSAARSEQFETETRSDYFNKELQATYTKLSAYETNTEIKSLGDGTKYTVTTLKPGKGTKEDAAEVEYLDVRKKELISSVNKADYDGILARAKMNSVKTALKNDRKSASQGKKSTSSAKPKVSEKIAEHNQIFDSYTDDLQRAHVTMTIEARKTDTAGNEYIRKNTKANVIGESSKRLNELRKNNSASGATEIFRQEIIDKKNFAEYKEDSSKDPVDKAMYAGAKGAYSLVLDKVRPLN